MSAKKDNKKDRKPELKYISQGLMYETSYAMMAGALKYGEFNYLKGHKASDLIEAAVRHLYSALNGDEYDTDCSERLGMPVSHLGCASANINMLLAQIEAGTVIDDLHSNATRARNLKDQEDMYYTLDTRLSQLIEEYENENAGTSHSYDFNVVTDKGQCSSKTGNI